MGKNLYAIVIGKDHIETGNILPVAKVIGKLEEMGEETFQSLALTFEGYDDTPVELWEMPEIRQWCHKLINKIPYLFYFIENEAYQTQQTLMICLNDYESFLAGESKSPEEMFEEGMDFNNLPKHRIKIHIHQKSFRLMCAEIRKYARKLGKMALAEQVIKEMGERYGVSLD